MQLRVRNRSGSGRSPLEELTDMPLKHLEGIRNYCRARVRFGVVQALNGNIRMLINRGRRYKNVRYLPPQGQTLWP
jgi:hypothetical protein